MFVGGASDGKWLWVEALQDASLPEYWITHEPPPFGIEIEEGLFETGQMELITESYTMMPLCIGEADKVHIYRLGSISDSDAFIMLLNGYRRKG